MRRAIRVERRLAAPPGALFEILADHAHYDRFAGIRRSQLAKEGSPDANGLGAVRWIWLGPLRFQEEVTASEPPARLDYLITDVKGLPFRHEGGNIRLEPDGTGTHALWTSAFEIPIPLAGRALDRVFATQLARGFGRVLEQSDEIASRSVASGG